MNELLRHSSVLMNIEIIMLSEKSQKTQSNLYDRKQVNDGLQICGGGVSRVIAR